MENGDDDSNLPSERALTLCKSFLKGSWDYVKQDDMVISRMGGGLSNHLYLCSLPKGKAPIGSEPPTVLIRLFGRHLKPYADLEMSEKLLAGIVMENVIFTVLSERNLGPRLFGVFGGGRLEEYIPSKSLVNSQMRDPAFSMAIGRKVARVHNLSVPISKDSNWLINTLNSWNIVISKVSLDMVEDPTEREVAGRLLSYDYDAEIDFLRSFLPSVQSPVVFCHNDLQGGNILLREEDCGSTEDNLAFIDFEFCSYNYRAFDIVNHWSEWMYDYGADCFPFFHTFPERYPTESQQMEFLCAYLDQIESCGGRGGRQHDSSEIPACGTNKKKMEMLREVSSFRMVPHLLWGLWAIRQAVDSKIVFGYWFYAADRIDKYYEQKERILSEKHLKDQKITLRTSPGIF